MSTDGRDFAPNNEPVRPAVFENAPDLLSAFDANVAKSRSAIEGMADDKLGVPWTLRAGDHVIFTLPRGAVLRSMLMNHIIHHRGQLSVYLRLNEVPLPSIYGGPDLAEHCILSVVQRGATRQSDNVSPPGTAAPRSTKVIGVAAVNDATCLLLSST